MCFKTAGLPAPSKAAFVSTNIRNSADNRDSLGSFTFSAKATDVREVELGFGSNPSDTRFASPYGLRALATHLNELADKLEA